MERVAGPSDKVLTNHEIIGPPCIVTVIVVEEEDAPHFVTFSPYSCLPFCC